MTPPPSLNGPDLAPLWVAVRDRLERLGSTRRGRFRLPTLSTLGRQHLTSLLGRPLTQTVELHDLERALVRVGAGVDLVDALDNLGHAMSFVREHLRDERRVRGNARDAARGEVTAWPEVWAKSWIDEVIQSGLLRGFDIDGALGVVIDVRRCLDALALTDQPRSRVDLAARILGDSHALDLGTRLGASVSRALRQQYATELHDDTDRTVWDRAGAPNDSVSAPVLTWNVPLVGQGGLSPLTATSTALGVVVHLSQMALRSYPVQVRAGTAVLVAENPRVVEAAAQRRSPLCVVSTNGNPSVAVRLLLSQLLDSGADVRYHGDFDAAGLSICRRMAAFGLRPWRMDVEHYERSVAEALAAGVDLPLDDADPGPTPWDEPLRKVFRSSGRVVHQERLLDELLEFVSDR